MILYLFINTNNLGLDNTVYMVHNFYAVAATRKKKVGGRSKKKSQGSEDEAGEETDEGDMESREVDYMSDSSSDSEHEFQVGMSHVTVT